MRGGRALRWSRRAGLTPALLGLAACTVSDAGRVACTEAGEDAPVVANRGAGAWAAAGTTPRLREIWRAGGLEEGRDLGLPISAAVSADGTIAIPDFVLGEVVVVGSDGSWQGWWTRQGDGPGEVRVPVAAAWREDGTLAVFDVAGSKVVFLDEDGPVGDDLRLDGSFTGPVLATGAIDWAGLQEDGTAFLQARDGAGETGALSVVVTKLAPHGTAPDTLAHREVAGLGAPHLRPVPGWPRPVAAAGGEGAVALFTGDRGYRVEIRNRRGGVERVICREAEGLPLTDTERGVGAGPDHEGLADAIRSGPRPEPPAPVGRLLLDRDGRLWVQRDRPDPFVELAALQGQPGSLHDVFDPDGRYLGAIRMPEAARLQAASGDTIWTFEIGSLDETWVVAYRLTLE